MCPGSKDLSLSFKALVSCCFFLGLTYVFAVSTVDVPSSFNAVELFRSNKEIKAFSPDPRASIVLLPPVNEEADPKIQLRLNGTAIYLGTLNRSGFVIWKDDSSAAALWDLAYSNHYFVRLIRVKPTPTEVLGLDSLIKRRVRSEFHAQEILHYWPYVEGWANNNLLVIVCADGLPPHSSDSRDSHLIGYSHAYFVDTNRLAIASEVSASGFVKRHIPNRCK